MKNMKPVMMTLLSLGFLFLFSNTETTAQTCYITKTGSKYHEGNCSYLRSSAFAIDLNKALNLGYTSCSRCRPTASSLKRNSTTPRTDHTLRERPKKSNTQCITMICSGRTKSGRSCRNKTKHCSGKCHHHR